MGIGFDPRSNPLSGGGGGGGGGFGGLMGVGLNALFPGAGAIAGPLLGMLGGLGGGAAQIAALNQGRDDIRGLPGMDGPTSLSGNFGHAGADGNFQMNQGMLNTQNMLGSQSQGLMAGGLFNNPQFQQMFQNNNMAGANAQANQAFGTQQGAQGFQGGLANVFGNQMGLGNQFSQATAAGPQDMFGGQGGQLRNAGMQNMLGAANQQGLQASELANMRAAAQPQQDRQFNKLQDRLFSMGMGGSTGGGAQMQGLFDSFGQQDMNFQNEAFNRANTRSNTMANQGNAMFGQGMGANQANLNQFNQNAQFANMFNQGAQGAEGQQFGQQLGANQFNTSQGMNRINNAMNIFGQGNQVFGDQFGLGLQGASGQLDFGRFGLDAAAMPQQIQAGLLQGGGEHAAALQANAAAQADAQGGFLGGLFS